MTFGAAYRRRTLAGKTSGPALEGDTEGAIKSALSLLGPAITEYRPRLESILDARTDRQGRVKTWNWELTLVRMGASPESFEKPSSRGGSEDDYHRSLRRDVERFERDLERERQQPTI